MRVEAYNGFEFWVENATKSKLPEREDPFVNDTQSGTLHVPINEDVVFCIKKGRKGLQYKRGPRDKPDYVAYLTVDGRDAGVAYIKRGNTVPIKIPGIYELIGGDMNHLPLQLTGLKTGFDGAGELPAAMGKISMAIYKVTLKARGKSQLQLIPFDDFPTVKPAFGGAHIYGFTKGQPKPGKMEESRHRWVIDESIRKVDRSETPWLTMEFTYRPDVSTAAQYSTSDDILVLRQELHDLRGEVADLRRDRKDWDARSRDFSKRSPKGQDSQPLESSLEGLMEIEDYLLADSEHEEEPDGTRNRRCLSGTPLMELDDDI